MKIVRFDSVGGASGDMILGALIALGAEVQEIARELDRLLPEHFTLRVNPAASYGISGVRAEVMLPKTEHHHHGHDHHHFREIRALIEGSELPAGVKRSSTAVFALLAEVEGKIHGKAAEEVAFHEVGAVDSIVDIVGACFAMHLLGVEAVSVSPLPVGYGTLKCAHGLLPIPAPATAELLTRGLEIAPSDEPSELLTPTGAALLAAWPKQEIPAGGRVLKVANSFGMRELRHRPNLLRAMLVECDPAPGEADEPVEELCCNLDDCTGEVIGNLCEELLESGALDAWIEAIQMKKFRPGIKLCVLCRTADREKLLELIFRESTTLGVRIVPAARRILRRETHQTVTSYGPVPVKVGFLGQDLCSVKPEFDACREIAAANGVPVKAVIGEALKRFSAEK